MIYLGDFDRGCTIYLLFTTLAPNGTPSALSGNPPVTLSAYRDANLACTTAGLTLALNCNGRTGVNGLAVNTNLSTYDCGHDYTVLLDGGTVAGNCVSGYTVLHFSLNNRNHLRPVIHGQSRVSVDSSGNLSGSIGSVATGGIAATSFAAGAIDAAAIAASAIGASEIATGAIDADALAADAANEIRDAIYDGSPTEGYAAVTAAPTFAQFLHMIWSAIANFDIVNTTMTTRKIDHCTTAMTFTLNDPLTPSDRTRAT